MLRGQSLATDEIDANNGHNEDAKIDERAGNSNNYVQTQSVETD